MRLLDIFLKKNKNNTASLAKNRLGFLMTSHSSDQNLNANLPQMREEILQVIAKYFVIDRDAIHVMMEHNNGIDMLEIEIPLN
jgi:cell division topological specificity factor